MRAPRVDRGLDWLNFFVADLQTGFGPFIAVYLTDHKWTQLDIGFALSLGSAMSMAAQVPAGVLVDAMASKRLAAGLGQVEFRDGPRRGIQHRVLEFWLFRRGVETLAQP